MLEDEIQPAPNVQKAGAIIMNNKERKRKEQRY